LSRSSLPAAERANRPTTVKVTDAGPDNGGMPARTASPTRAHRRATGARRTGGHRTGRVVILRGVAALAAVAVAAVTVAPAAGASAPVTAGRPGTGHHGTGPHRPEPPVSGRAAHRRGVGPAPLLAATTNPSRSMSPSAAFDRTCFSLNRAAACNKAALADIDLARKAEHLRSIWLPPGFTTWTPAHQMRVIANHERQVRGLPTLPENAALDTLAQAGAVAGFDPTGPPDFTWGSNLSWGYATPLAADFGWMYDDGPDSPNGACTWAGAPGCWGHRDNILSPWGGAQGEGVTVVDGTVRLTQLFVDGF
jgi:hypothetical protein